MNPSYDFTGQVALVTGASSGMGLAIAGAFAQAGAAVVLADINENALRTATDTLATAGHQVLGVPCDVANEASVVATTPPKPSPTSPSTDSANPTRSPRPSCGCAAPVPASSSASPSPSTAATPHADPSTPASETPPSPAPQEMVIASSAAR